jgi:hypothetical protein
MDTYYKVCVIKTVYTNLNHPICTIERHVNCETFTTAGTVAGQWVSDLPLPADKHHVTIQQIEPQNHTGGA